jgi:antitoxin StbD
MCRRARFEPGFPARGRKRGHILRETLVVARAPRSRVPSQVLLPEVESVREAKSHLSAFLDEARKLGADAPPRRFGAHRRPEAVVLSYEGWLQLLDAAENLELAVVAANRTATRGKKSIELDEAMELLGFDPDEHSLA